MDDVEIKDVVAETKMPRPHARTHLPDGPVRSAWRAAALDVRDRTGYRRGAGPSQTHARARHATQARMSGCLDVLDARVYEYDPRAHRVSESEVHGSVPNLTPLAAAGLEV